ncbi:MlaE family ABC transporter permease [Gordonia crocea]|uniref:Putative YrbE family protein n=1 Tax=Gordonia crocea TaxID=589162 RepID=A0A7I9V160_9ACTN|nr:ABC transporter permease [Gordonia crocea]GED98739.1 putative YrbE family protein [Gordonia crocea]
MGVPAAYRPTGLGWLYGLSGKAVEALANVGHFLSFAYYAVRYAPQAMWRFRGQTIRTVTDLAWGRGAIIVGGGTALVMAVLGLAAGATVAIVAHGTLSMLDLGPVAGSVSSYAITREFAPLLAALGFAVQAGCRMTAEIGSMRISEEIDALEVVGVHSIAFVVSTRVIAGIITILPTFLIAILAAYLSSAVVVQTRGESAGAYNHYFNQFINFPDLVYATLKVAIFIIVVIVIHCYKGYFAAGGPEGVGVASGRAIRASLVAIVALDLVLTLIFWGFNSPFVFRG